MKNKIKSLVCSLALAAVVAFGTASWFTASAASPRKGSSNTTVTVNPAKKFCYIVDGVTKRIYACTSQAQVEKVLGDLEGIDTDLDESYRLKPSDRTALKNSLKGMFRAIMIKAGEFEGIDVTDMPEVVNAFDDTMDAVVDNSDTLGDIGTNMETASSALF